MEHTTTSGPAAASGRPGDEARAAYWVRAREQLDGLPGGRGLNIAHEAVDRHAAGPRADRPALRAVRRDGTHADLTYAALRSRTNRFANALTSLGVGPGGGVFVLLPRVPDLHVAVLGALKARCVVTPLFPSFGPGPVQERLVLGRGRVLVTTSSLYRRKVEAVRAELPDLEHVVLVGPDDEPPPGTVRLDDLLGPAGDDFTIPPTDPEDPALVHFTSGTTGPPKGVLHVHDAVVAHHATAAEALGLGPDDIFWCTADPGWVTGMTYGVIAPLTHGATNLVVEADFDAARWYQTLQDEQVTVWYTSPTALRMLMRSGTDLARAYDLRALRFVGSVGEPLDPEAVRWSQRALGVPVHDNWWQTETGGIMIANAAAAPVTPGSMGRPLPGIEAAVLARDPHGTGDGEVLVADGEPVPVEEPGTEGHLALRRGWPSMFRGYVGAEDRYRRSFVGDWYVSGDLARRDADGRFWFVGRADDMIKSAGHLIGPFEVERALLAHPAVAEAGVVGAPDDVAGQVVTAFVSLHTGHEPGDGLRRELLAFTRTRLGPAVAPRTIVFDQDLPKTRSGKIVRRELRARAAAPPPDSPTGTDGGARPAAAPPAVEVGP